MAGNSSMAEGYRFLRVSRDGQIATVTLNRPDAFNALNSGLMAEIEQASRGFMEDEQSRVVIFRGAGKHFSAGADLKETPEPQNLVMRRRTAGLGGRMIRAITEIPQVTIASLHGVALGGGRMYRNGL